MDGELTSTTESPDFCPEQFSICAGVLRTEARAKEVALKEGIFATADLDQALERKPDFAVLVFQGILPRITW